MVKGKERKDGGMEGKDERGGKERKERERR